MAGIYDKGLKPLPDRSPAKPLKVATLPPNVQAPPQPKPKPQPVYKTNPIRK